MHLYVLCLGCFARTGHQSDLGGGEGQSSHFKPTARIDNVDTQRMAWQYVDTT
jgi:hypothetical protein